VGPIPLDLMLFMNNTHFSSTIPLSIQFRRQTPKVVPLQIITKCLLEVYFTFLHVEKAHWNIIPPRLGKFSHFNGIKLVEVLNLLPC
jgi:hypothetical protein